MFPAVRPIFVLAALLLLIGGCALQSHAVRPADDNQSEAVVFDIDGTLTPRPFAIFKVRPEAARAVQSYADQGLAIIYLSARVKLFQSFIPGWLEKNGFPAGSIHVTQTSEDSGDHAAFKQRVLEEYARSGWSFVAAYGDSSTDFEAYAEAGIEQDRVFALKRTNKESCQPGPWAECLADWQDHADTLAAGDSP